MNFRFKSYLEITRPVNVLICALTIFVGALITGRLEPVLKIMLACFSGALIMAGGNVINDYFDYEIDQVNKSSRPLPAKKMGRREALLFSIILFAFGIFLSIFIKFSAFAVALFTSIGLLIYSAILKRGIILGNVAVSLFAGLAFIYGGMALDRWQEALIPAGFAFLFHLGREILKDVEDKKADAVFSAKTLPIRFGDKTAFLAVTIVFTILILLTFVPFMLNIYGKGYFWIVSLGVDLVLIFALTLMWLRPVPENLKRISTILKADMLVGLLAIYVGNLT